MSTTRPDPAPGPATLPVADEENSFLVIPEQVWRSAEQEYVHHVDEEDEDHDLEDRREPVSRNVVSMTGGLATSLIASLIPSLFVAPPAALVAGAAAGIFGGLMGASLANEFYDRRHPENR
ncbi:MAG: hypothetical protein ABW224_19955 [Kibdelosporangium sp.]